MSASQNNIQDSASKDSSPPSDSPPTAVFPVTDTELFDMHEALAEDIFEIMDDMVIPPELHWAVITYMRAFLNVDYHEALAAVCRLVVFVGGQAAMNLLQSLPRR